MKEIAHFAHPELAHLVSAYLEAQGIRTSVVGDNLISGGLVPPKDMRATVYVHVEDEARTLEVLAKFERDRTTGEAWDCPECGDTLPTAFVECPVCRVARPSTESRPPDGE